MVCALPEVQKSEKENFIEIWASLMAFGHMKIALSRHFLKVKYIKLHNKNESKISVNLCF